MKINEYTNGQVADFSEAKTDEKSFLLNTESNDYGNALCLEFLNPGLFADVYEWGTLYFNGKYWDKANAKKVLYESTIVMMQKRANYFLEERDKYEEKSKDHKKWDTKLNGVGKNEGKTNACMSAFSKLINIAKPVDFFNNHNHYFNAANGVADLRTGELLPHDPKYGFTWVSPTNYNPNAKSELWLNFLAQSVGNYNETSDFVAKCVGYALTGDCREERLFYLYGVTRSGKSTFLEVIKSVMGDDIAKGTSFSTFTRSRSDSGGANGFDIAAISTARLITATESEAGAKVNESLIKSITGNDMMSAAFKGRDYFTFKPHFKIFLASNYKPIASVSDEALWQRFVMILFPNSNVGKEDTSLKEKLISKENLEGVLAWAVDGSIKWYTQNATKGIPLTVPEVYKQALKDAREEIDSIGKWLNDWCEVDQGNHKCVVSLKEASDSYTTYCQENGMTPWKTFNKNMEDKGFKQGIGNAKVFPLNGEGKPIRKTVRTWVGLRLKDDVDFVLS